VEKSSSTARSTTPNAEICTASTPGSSATAWTTVAMAPTRKIASKWHSHARPTNTNANWALVSEKTCGVMDLG